MQLAKTHGGYAKFLDAEELFDQARELQLRDELEFTRARVISVTKLLKGLQQDLVTATEMTDRIALYDKILKAEQALDRNIQRIESIERTLSTLRIDEVTGPKIEADTKRIQAATRKLAAEADLLEKDGAQELLFRTMWYLNIVLKARQLGFSTAIDIYLLDEALFNKNLKCGIIAHDLTAAGEIYRTKIEIPIQVATSFRSGTVQRLHVSEHGKICAKYPEKAKEVRTGTLQAIHPGAVAFIESTAEGVGGDFHAMSMKSLELAKSCGELTQQDWKFPLLRLVARSQVPFRCPASGVTMSKDQAEYFDAVELAMDCTITDEQRQWYVLKEATLGDEMKQEFPSTPLEAFLTSGRRVFAPTMTMRAEGDCRPPELVYDMDPVTGKRERVNGPETLDERGQRSLANLLLLVAHVGRWYGTEEYGPAFVGPERNNHGHAFLLRLRDIYPTRRIYCQEYIDRESDDETDRLGWLTTAQSKPIVVDGLKTLLRAGQSGIRWIDLMSDIQHQPDWRSFANLCCAYYDNDQLLASVKKVLKDRGQPNTIHNLIAPTIDGVLGMEAKTPH
ncbi:UNVERIFIED_CONTAM: hypothetical protein K2H54_000160 [Gekko kuhli]